MSDQSGKDMVDAFASLEKKRRLSKAPEEDFNREQLARAKKEAEK